MGRPRKRKPAPRKTAASTVEKLRRLGDETRTLRRQTDEAEAELAAFHEQRQPAFDRWLDAEFAAERHQVKANGDTIIIERQLCRQLAGLRSQGRAITPKMAAEIRELIRTELANIRAGVYDDELNEVDFDGEPGFDDESDAAKRDPLDAVRAEAGGSPPPSATGTERPSDSEASSALATAGGRPGLGNDDPEVEDAFFNELFESMPRELFERLFEDQFEAFFYDTRGRDPEEADPAEVARARSEFRSAFAKLFGGDEEAGYEHLMRSAADLSPHRLSELKSLYRSLVRSLHPDRADSFGPEEKRLWEEVQAAHRCLDLDGLRELDVTLHLVRGEPVPPAKAPVLRAMHSRLREQLAMLREDLEEARNTFAWRYDEHGDLKALSGDVAAFFQTQFAQDAAELEDLRQRIALLTRPSGPAIRPKRRVTAGASKKLAARKSPPDPDTPVQLEFQF